jgi:hypothetical protein
VQPWLVRLSWLAIPFTVGTAIAGALDGRSTAVQLTAAVLLWTAWAAVVVGLLVPRPASLVGLRVAGAALVPLVAWSGDSALDWWVAGVHAVVMTALALAPATGEWLVNGTAYGYERRYPLRVPVPILAGPIEVAALALVPAVAAGPLLLAAGRWAGVVALALGIPVAVVLFRALHSMAMRWAVLVPAGLVLKDHLSLPDPILFRRADIEVLQSAPAASDALDLTAGAPGRALELRLRDPQHIDRMRPVRRGAEPYDEVWRMLFTPTRPDALLQDAASRNIRVHALS